MCVVHFAAGVSLGPKSRGVFQAVQPISRRRHIVAYCDGHADGSRVSEPGCLVTKVVTDDLLVI